MFEFGTNLSLMFGEVPLVERFAVARSAGFRAVEIQFPYDHDPGLLAATARQAGVEVVLINAPVAPDQPFGLACRPDRVEEFREGFDDVERYAAALGVRKINVLAGQTDGLSLTECRSCLLGQLAWAADRLAARGIEVLLEALNPFDVPRYAVSDLVTAESVLRACSGRVGFQFDIYHVARMGHDPHERLAAMLPLVRHVQFADAPGRHEPGTGALRFEPLWELLRESAYEGCVSAEYRPQRSTLESLGWLEAWRRFITLR
jgi:hydroxypyruvate isomerase